MFTGLVVQVLPLHLRYRPIGISLRESGISFGRASVPEVNKINASLSARARAVSQQFGVFPKREIEGAGTRGPTGQSMMGMPRVCATPRLAEQHQHALTAPLPAGRRNSVAIRPRRSLGSGHTYGGGCDGDNGGRGVWSSGQHDCYPIASAYAAPS